MDGDGAASVFSYGLERLILGCTTLVIFNSVYCFRGGSLALERLLPVRCPRVSFGPPASSLRPCQRETAPSGNPSTALGRRLISGLCVGRSAPVASTTRRSPASAERSRTTLQVESDQTVTAASSEGRPRAEGPSSGDPTSPHPRLVPRMRLTTSSSRPR